MPKSRTIIRLTPAQVAVAAKIGMSPAEYAEHVVSERRARRRAAAFRGWRTRMRKLRRRK